MKKYDAIIIGFGKGGKTLAGWLAAQGKSVAVIEKDNKMYGGTCINIGCIPTKILVEESEEKQRSYSEAIDWKNTLVSKLRTANYNKLDTFTNVDVIDGLASFIDQHTIEVIKENETIQISGEHIFINTGAKEFIPNIEGISNTKGVYTSTTIMELKELPKRLVIIGGGYIGLEFASIYSNFGSKVQILEGTDAILQREEPEVANEIRNDLANRGIEVITKAQVTKVENTTNNTVIITFSKDGVATKIEADGVLIASGRRPNVEALKLENAGISYDVFGIKVNEHLQTNVPHIYALGDVKGGLQFTYISLDDFRIIRDHLSDKGSLTTNSRNVIAYSLFVSPTLSRVGMTEQEAVGKGFKVKTKLMKATSIPRAKILKVEQGIYKAIINADNGEILGCSLYGAESSEIINIVAMAIKEKKHFSYLRDFIFTHPTMAESLNDLFDL